MTDQELAEIRARVDMATPPPWEQEVDDMGELRLWIQGKNNVCDVIYFGDMEETEAEDHANAEFIAHARADVPKLLEEIKHLKLELWQVTQTLHMMAEE